MPPAAHGVRITWPDLPEHVRDWVLDLIGGGPVVSAQSQRGGFSPGRADRVLTAGGQRAFFKAVSPAQNDPTPDLHRREAEVVTQLPLSQRIPRLLGRYDDGVWVVLVIEDVPGRMPAVPWVSAELESAMTALTELADDLTPSPAPQLGLLEEAFSEEFGGWRPLRDDPPAALDGWAGAHLDELVDLADRGRAALAGNTLVHLDVRADNLLLTPDGSVVVVDWPWARNGAARVDRLLLAINTDLYGGHDPDALIGRHLGSVVEPDTITAAIAGFSGFFTDAARQPPVPGVPTVRAFQADQASSTLAWLRRRLE